MSPESPKVSIIIPVYNTKLYLQRCLDSIFSQSYANFEILAVNDGSHDGSRRVLERNAQHDSRLRILDQDNQGQGVARNRALDQAKGEFVLFVDADDFIEPLTLELTVARALEDSSDFVHFDWKLASRLRHRPKAYNYFNIRNIWSRRVLSGAECDELMDTVSFFTVTSLYRKTFLDENNIRFGEGYIYEDNPFYVLAANKASRISLLHSPLYVVQPNPASTTQRDKLTDRHYVGHIRAIRASIAHLDIRSDATITYFLKYHLQKFMEYYDTRVPRNLRSQYARDFVDAFAEVPITLDPSIPVNRYVRLFVRNEVFSKRNYSLFQFIVSGRQQFAPPVKRRIESVRRSLGRANQRRTDTAKQKSLAHQSASLHDRNFAGAFLFLGFDHRYAGNSRYLFEQMLRDERFEQQPLYFITDDTRVDESARIAPSDSDLIDLALSQASVVVAESWVPPRYRKAPDSVWIQLWHGTPFKRVLFDSHEGRIISTRNDHKVLKHRDTQKWDFLLADSELGREKFKSALLFPEERIIQAGYPRVRYLLENRENEELKAQVRAALGISRAKKVVLYAPTWRDYNYGLEPSEMDFRYTLDLNEFAGSLGDDYVVLFHDHDYLKNEPAEFNPRCIDATSTDIQDLILISDAVVSDYSSVVFDCFALGTPVALYCTDAEKFENERGTYADIWEALSPIVTDSLEGAVALIQSPPDFLKSAEFLERYAYGPQEDLLDFLDQLDLHNLNRDW